jgi:hypothetical protein
VGDLLSSTLVEVAIGLIVVWFAAATITSTIVEVIAGIFQFRAKHLWRYLSRVLDDANDERQPLRDALKLGVNPLVDVASTRADPSAGRTPLELFADTVHGCIVNIAKSPVIDEIAKSDAVAGIIAAAQNPAFLETKAGKVLGTLAGSVVADRDAAAKWFDEHMQLASNAYRRNIRKWSALVGVFVIGALGIDTIGLAERLYREPQTRQLTSVIAQQVVAGDPGCRFLPTTTTQLPSGGTAKPKSSTTSSPTTTSTASPTTTTTLKTTSFADGTACVKGVTKALVPIRLSLWQHQDGKTLGQLLWPQGIFGLILSAAAVAAGAPFWFAILKRLMAMRSGASS